MTTTGTERNRNRIQKDKRRRKRQRKTNDDVDDCHHNTNKYYSNITNFNLKSQVKQYYITEPITIILTKYIIVSNGSSIGRLDNNIAGSFSNAFKSVWI